MKIKLVSIFVDDQAKGLEFYTGTLGFVKKHDMDLGPARWLTVVSPDAPDEAELVLEPSDNPAAQRFKKEIKEQGIPFTAFQVDSIQKEFDRLKSLGVKFTMEPTPMGPVTIAVFDDTCGNLIQIYEA